MTETRVTTDELRRRLGHDGTPEEPLISALREGEWWTLDSDTAGRFMQARADAQERQVFGGHFGDQDVEVTQTGRVMTDADFERLADEAEQGYDVSGLPPTLPSVWVAELVNGKRVVGRVLLTSRADADMALAAHWRIVRYVRADRAPGP